MIALQTKHPLLRSDRWRESRIQPSRAALAARYAAMMAGAGLLFLVARDGSPLWQLVRLVAAAAVVGVSYLAITRGGRTRGAIAAFALGCVTGPVGVGIGLPHVAKAGMSLTAMAGLFTLFGGVVLVAVGGATLIRVTRRWWRGLVAPALLVALFVSVWTIGQGVAATNVPRTDLAAVTPADRGLTYRDVTFETGDDVTLSGWFVPSTSGAAVVLLHGSGSTRSAVLDHAVVLARRGLGVLLFDARGHGRSGGRAMDFGWYGDEDITAAVSFLETQPGVDGSRIGAVGMSMGGEEAIGAAAADPRIRAVVAEGATNRVASDKAWLSEEFGLRGAIQEQIERLVTSTADLLTAADPPISLRQAVAVAAPRRVLLIAGSNKPDEPPAGRHIQSGSPDTVQLWVVPDTGHTDALRTHPQQWEDRVGSFLTSALSTNGV